ncbi:MAG TPA: hypothetical protein VFA90_02135 [Terriglobales bacterium]|nr:hypothetical protein [Terriglobales bacterium]
MKSKIQFAALLVAMLAGTVGLSAAQGYGDYRYGNGYYDRYDMHGGMHAAREFGRHDGASVAREDMWRGKPFNPNPRGPYSRADNGYRREFGRIRDYREMYAQAYREAYANAFRSRRYYR